MQALAVCLCLLIGLGGLATSEPPLPVWQPVTPEARALITPILEAIATEQRRQALLPAPKDDSERIIRLGRLDQVGRQMEAQLDLSELSESARASAYAALAREMEAVDQANQAALLAMVPPEGRFYRSRYGAEAPDAASLIIQHANPELWRRFAPVLEPLAQSGEIHGAMYALMYDRLALAEGRPQRYGSQMVCLEGRFVVAPLEDRERVDERRRVLGMGPLAQYEAQFQQRPPCSG
jgi:hypothetical protein